MPIAQMTQAGIKMGEEENIKVALQAKSQLE